MKIIVWMVCNHAYICLWYIEYVKMWFIVIKISHWSESNEVLHISVVIQSCLLPAVVWDLLLLAWSIISIGSLSSGYLVEEFSTLHISSNFWREELFHVRKKVNYRSAKEKGVNLIGKKDDLVKSHYNVMRDLDTTLCGRIS